MCPPLLLVLLTLPYILLSPAPVMQYSDRLMSGKCFSHLLNLSLAWHTKVSGPLQYARPIALLTSHFLRLYYRKRRGRFSGFSIEAQRSTTCSRSVSTSFPHLSESRRPHLCLLCFPQLILFNVLPVFFDIITALLIFYFKFGPALAALIFVVMAA